MYLIQIHGLYTLSRVLWLWMLWVKNGLGTNGGQHTGKHSVLLYHADPHFLRVPCWKITLFVIVPVLGPLVALIICYNWLHRRLAGAVSGQQRGPLCSRELRQTRMGKGVEPRF